MDNVFKIEKSAEAGVVDFLRFLLTEKKVSGVFTLRKTGKSGSVDYGLITDPAGLDAAIPLDPLMPANAGQILSSITPSKKNIAVVIKPCEIRSLIERIKRGQGSLENLLLISYTCGGTFPFHVSVENKLDKLRSGYMKAAVEGEVGENIRPACTACEYFVPMNADITVSFIGEKNLDKECRMFLHTEKAKEMIRGFEGQAAEDELESKLTKALLEKRKEKKEALFENNDPKNIGLDGLIDVFGKCIGCHACSRVCPICYCVLCDFDSHHFDYEASYLESDLVKRGALRFPPDTIFFQLGRMSHMSFSCVGCGQCTEVCPADIPVSTLFMKVGMDTAALFDYVPGRDVEESIPVMVFKEQEFQEIGEE